MCDLRAWGACLALASAVLAAASVLLAANCSAAKAAIWQAWDLIDSIYFSPNGWESLQLWLAKMWDYQKAFTDAIAEFVKHFSWQDARGRFRTLVGTANDTYYRRWWYGERCRLFMLCETYHAVAVMDTLCAWANCSNWNDFVDRANLCSDLLNCPSLNLDKCSYDPMPSDNCSDSGRGDCDIYFSEIRATMFIPGAWVFEIGGIIGAIGALARVRPPNVQKPLL